MRIAWIAGHPSGRFHRHGPTCNRTKYQALAQGVADRGERPFHCYRGEIAVLTLPQGLAAGPRPQPSHLRRRRQSGIRVPNGATSPRCVVFRR